MHASLLQSLSYIHDILSDKVTPKKITVAGWLRTKRSSKKFSFLELNDGTSSTSLQIVVDATLPDYSEIEKLNTGSSVVVHGELVLSPGKGQKYEMHATSVEILGHADPVEYPLQKKEMTLEYLRENAFLRMRTATFSSVFRIRSRVSFMIHKFFFDKGFYYLNSPIVTAVDGEGAGESFQVTNFNLKEIPKTKNGEVDFSKDFFGTNSMLCVTGQLEGELFACGMNKIYTFGPTFRAENSHTSRHLAEFWMIEPEVAFANLEDNMDLAQELIRYVVKDVLDNSQEDLQILFQKTQIDTKEYLKMALEKPFVRVSYTEAIEILKNSKQNFEISVEWGIDLKSEHERYLCEKHFCAPTIVYNYPQEFKAFYMYLNDDGKTVRAMDVLMPGIGEVIGGSQREDRYEVLKRRMEEKGLSPEKMQWYLDTRKFGNVPHAGFGLGLERLIVWITGMGNVRDVIPFPRTPGQCEF